MKFIDKNDLLIVVALVIAACLVELSGIWLVRIALMSIGLIGIYFVYKWDKIMLPYFKIMTILPSIDKLMNNKKKGD